MANVSSSNSQKALVPKLRFHDANGAEFPQLTSETVGTLFSHISRRNSDMKNNNVITNSAEFGLIPQRDFFDKDIAVEGNTDKYYIIGRGDFVYNPRKSTTAPYGPFNCYQGEEEGIVSPLYTCLKPLYPEMADYLLWYFRSPAWYSYIYHNGTQGGARHDRVGMTNELMDGIPVNLPCKTEQKKINDFLTLLDKRITAQQQLVEALKSYKRGVLATVFDEDNCLLKIDRTSWKQYKIGDFLFPRVSKQVPTPDAPLMAFTAEGGVCPKGDRYDRSFLVKDENKQYKRTELNDFIYSSNNLDVGSIGLNKYGSAVISDVYEIFTIKGADISFIAEAICRPQTIAKILKYRQGVIYGQYRIYAENFLEVDICLPPLKEQIIYSQIFSKFDDRIVRENTLLKDLTGIKLGLLQRLFI